MSLYEKVIHEPTVEIHNDEDFLKLLEEVRTDIGNHDEEIIRMPLKKILRMVRSPDNYEIKGPRIKGYTHIPKRVDFSIAKGRIGRYLSSRTSSLSLDEFLENFGQMANIR